tara:strand:+ start:288 stop:626 length:339 start_codon:yes stop_codon:yes gene_type:complete
MEITDEKLIVNNLIKDFLTMDTRQLLKIIKENGLKKSHKGVTNKYVLKTNILKFYCNKFDLDYNDYHEEMIELQRNRYQDIPVEKPDIVALKNRIKILKEELKQLKNKNKIV